MTNAEMDSAEQLAGQIVARRDAGEPLDITAEAQALRRAGLGALATGWALRVVFGVSIPEAVHLAKLAGDPP